MGLRERCMSEPGGVNTFAVHDASDRAPERAAVLGRVVRLQLRVRRDKGQCLLIAGGEPGPVGGGDADLGEVRPVLLPGLCQLPLRPRQGARVGVAVQVEQVLKLDPLPADWMARGLPGIPGWQAGACQPGMAARAGCAALERRARVRSARDVDAEVDVEPCAVAGQAQRAPRPLRGPTRLPPTRPPPSPPRPAWPSGAAGRAARPVGRPPQRR